MSIVPKIFATQSWSVIFTHELMQPFESYPGISHIFVLVFQRVWPPASARSLHNRAASSAALLTATGSEHIPDP